MAFRTAIAGVVLRDSRTVSGCRRWPATRETNRAADGAPNAWLHRKVIKHPSLPQQTSCSLWVLPPQQLLRVAPAVAQSHDATALYQCLPRCPTLPVTNGFHVVRCAEWATLSVTGDDGAFATAGLPDVSDNAGDGFRTPGLSAAAGLPALRRAAEQNRLRSCNLFSRHR
jgi:hypothetical protein